MAIYKGGTKISKIFIGDKEITKIYKGTQLVYSSGGDEPVLPPVVNCADLLTMYKGDTTLIETPIINATGCTSLREVFYGCTNLKTVKYIHAPNVATMYGMFRDCSSLTSIPEIDTSSVTNMSYMFRDCSSLTSIPEIDTIKVGSMLYMFQGCSSLTSIPEIDTSRVTNMSYMFRYCSSLTSTPPLDLSNASSTAGMFQACSSLTSVTFIGDVVPPYGANMFLGTPIDSGNGYIFVPDDLVDAYKNADGWSNYASVIRPVLPPVVDCSELLTMYKGDLTLIETPIINATGCTTLKNVFRGCTNLETVRYIHIPNVTDTYGIFYGCSSLTSIPKLDTRNVENMGYMFRDCSSLTSIPPLDVSNVNNMLAMFMNCSSLTSVTFTGDVVPPYRTNTFWNTPISYGNGYIFVPDNMVDAYKNAEGWSTHASVIKGISEQGALQSNISMYNMQIEENPTMFALTEKEELEMMRDMERDQMTGMKK